MKTLSASTPSQKQVLLTRVHQQIASQPTSGDMSLFGGQVGYALFEAYYNQYAGLSDDSRIWERLSNGLGAIQNGELVHNFGGGIAGVAWGFLHLFNHGLVQDDELDPNDIVEDLDEPLFEISKDMLKDGNFDYLHGGLSACLYYLERRPSPRIARFVNELVELLADVAVRYPNGDITWLFDNFGKATLDDQPTYNLGLAHGTPSIVAILSLLYEKGYARQRCAELIQGNLQWIWNNRNRTGLSVFPYSVKDVREDSDCRLAWCYGDLGVANTFWLAGEKLSQPAWKALAKHIVNRAAPRRSPEDTKIKDASLCHGSAGVAYIFRQFAQRLNDPVLHQTADYWLNETARYARPETEEEVFLYYTPNGYSPNLSLLEGETSIGMVLLAELGAPTHWDRFLLLS